MKPPLRTKSVGTKVSEAEYVLLEERACGAGMRLAEWVREALLSAPVNSGPDSGEVALGEVLFSPRKVCSRCGSEGGECCRHRNDQLFCASSFPWKRL